MTDVSELNELLGEQVSELSKAPLAASEVCCKLQHAAVKARLTNQCSKGVTCSPQPNLVRICHLMHVAH